MKDNFNIENLFQEKFENFQPEVNPKLWGNIQAGLGSTAAVTTGVSVAVKVGLISGGIIAASVATWYFGYYTPTQDQSTTPQTNTISLVDNTTHNNSEDESVIVVNDINDPVIIGNQANIERELRNSQPINGNNNSFNVNQNNLNNANSGNTNNNTNTTVNGGGNNNTTTNDVVVDNSTQVDKVKPAIPTGRMEFTQASVYAPSVVGFKSNAVNYKSVKWQFDDGGLAEGTEVKHTFTKPGTYLVKMTVVGEQNSYEESQEIVVKSKSSIDNIPNVITPNGDRINDYFSVSTTDMQSFFISIRDKQGNEVFTSNDKDFVWDGTDFDGNVLDKGMYTYIIIAEGKDGGVFKLPGQLYLQ